MAFIYVITNDINGKQYVGKTNNTVEERFREHVSDSKKRRCEKRPLYSAMNKYGVEHFHIRALEKCSAEKSAEREEYWIAKLNTYGHTGYNATRGGDSKKYYDYKYLAQESLKYNTQKEAAEALHCDIWTIRQACLEYNIPTDRGLEYTRRKNRKPLKAVDINDNNIEYTFPSRSAAIKWLMDCGLANSEKCGFRIYNALHNQVPSAYGFYWYNI